MDNAFDGDFAKTPFPWVLAGIWKEKKSGYLKIQDGAAEKYFFIEKGRLAIERKTFNGPGFLKSLMSLGLAGQADLDKAEAAARRDSRSLPQALLQERLFSAPRLWRLIESFTLSEIQAFFNLGQGRYYFEPGEVSAADLWITGLRLPGLILQGIRKMWNLGIIEAHLPSSTEKVQSLSLGGIDMDELEPHEKYILEASTAAKSLDELYRTSDLGEKETKRVLFAFLALGIVGTPIFRSRNNKPLPELSYADMDRLFNAFSDRSSFICKYIFKEIGPVALNVIEKSLDDIKGRIDPSFRHIQVKPDGRIDWGTAIKKNLGVANGDGKRNLLQSFDEILAAEVLAVKRTLGNSHEAALVRGLERLGDVY